MKKTLVMFAVAALAASVQAGTVAWNSGTIYLPDSTGALTSTTAGSGVVQAYYFVVDATEYGSFSAATDFGDRFDVNTSTGAITLKDGVSATYNRGTTGGGAANWTKTHAANADIAEGSTRYVFAFYTYTDANKNAFYVAANPYASLAKDAMDATGTFDGIFTAASANGWTLASSSTPDPGPIPEPTTVALLALGLAAVGLKRKIA